MKRAALVFLGVLLLTPCVPAQTPEQKKASLAYVQKLQNKDGGFSPAASTDQSSLRATNAAVRIFKYLGGELPNKTACGKFVESCFDKASGGFADTPGGKPDVATTAVGLMAVVELKMPRDPYVTPAVKYLSDNAKNFEDIRIAVAGLEAVEIKSPQREVWMATVMTKAEADGTFSKAASQPREAASVIVTLLRMGDINLQNKDALLKTLNAGQSKDGGFAKVDTKTSDLESSYRVMRCYHMMKSKPNATALTEFVGRCRNDDGGYGVTPGEKSTIAATYYAAIISYWLSEK
jgi:hypothetical protein